jgi:thioredoxin-dependent peroxiredoxin
VFDDPADDQDHQQCAGTGDHGFALGCLGLVFQGLLGVLGRAFWAGSVGQLVDGGGQRFPGVLDIALDLISTTLAGHGTPFAGTPRGPGQPSLVPCPGGVSARYGYPMTHLSPGDRAPEFTLPDADGKDVSLRDFRGRKVVVYFYPAAMTPGCTTQACDFRDNLNDLTEAGFAVVGISPDKPDKLAKFRDAEGLTFPLLSDPSRAVLEAYGAFGEKTMYGKKVTGVLRSTFVVDENGVLEAAQYNVKAAGHVAKLRRELAV